MDIALIKKIALAVFFVASLVLPQYAEEFKAMEADPEFWSTLMWVVTAVFAWLSKAPDLPFKLPSFTKKEEKK
jgi:hypothetical protein